jgi:hypothetical protein
MLIFLLDALKWKKNLQFSPVHTIKFIKKLCNNMIWMRNKNEEFPFNIVAILIYILKIDFYNKKLSKGVFKIFFLELGLGLLDLTF